MTGTNGILAPPEDHTYADLSIHETGNDDYFRITASATGQLSFDLDEVVTKTLGGLIVLPRDHYLNGRYGLRSWLLTKDHKRIALLYLFTVTAFFGLGGTFGGNVLPLLPPAIGNMELRYEQPLGFYAALNVKGASPAWVDFKNNLKANPYAVLGARIGYISRAGWSTFIEGQNLTNTHYANRISPTSNVTTADARRFYPGITRGFYGGFEYKFNAPM